MFHLRSRFFFFYLFLYFLNFYSSFSQLELSLHAAIQTQNKDRLPELLSRQIINVNKAINGKTPLSLAVEKQDLGTLRDLLRRGAKPTFSFEKGSGGSSDIFLDFEGKGGDEESQDLNFGSDESQRMSIRDSRDRGGESRGGEGRGGTENRAIRRRNNTPFSTSSQKTVSSRGVTTTFTTTTLAAPSPPPLSALWEILFTFFHHGFLPPLSSSLLSKSTTHGAPGIHLLNGLYDPFLNQTFSTTRIHNLPSIVSFPLKNCNLNLLRVLPVVGRSKRVCDLVLDGREGGFDQFVPDEELFYLRLCELLANLERAGGGLKSLCLINCKSPPSAPERLFAGHQLTKILKYSPNLQTLVLTNGAYLPPDQPTPFPQSLLHLDLSNNACPPFLLPTPYWTTVHLPSSLRELCLSGILPPKQNFQAKRSPSSQKFDSSDLSSHIVSRLSEELDNLPHLISLDLSSNSFSLDHFLLLSFSLASLSSLAHLNLSQTHLSSQSLQSLLKSLRRTPLSELNLAFNPLEVSCLENIFLLIKNCPTFRKLSLFGCELGDKGFEEVFRWLPSCPHLDSLDLGANDIHSLPSPLVVPLLPSSSSSSSPSPFPFRKFKSFKFAVNSVPDIHRLLSVIQARSLDLGGNSYSSSQLNQIVKRLWFDGYTQHLRISDSLDFFGRLDPPFLGYGSLLTLRLDCGLKEEKDGKLIEGEETAMAEKVRVVPGGVPVSLSTPLFPSWSPQLLSSSTQYSPLSSVSQPSLPPSMTQQSPLSSSSYFHPPQNLLYCDAFPSLSHPYRQTLLSSLTPNYSEWRRGEDIEKRLRRKEYGLIIAILRGDLAGVVREWEEESKSGKGEGGMDSLFGLANTRELAKSLGFPLFIEWVLRNMRLREGELILGGGRRKEKEPRLSSSEGGKEVAHRKPPSLVNSVDQSNVANCPPPPAQLQSSVLDLRSLHLSEWHLESLLLLLPTTPLATLDLRSNRPLHRIPRCLAHRPDITRILLDPSSLHPIERKVYQNSQGRMDQGIRQHLLDCEGVILSLRGLGLRNDHLLDLDLYRAREIDLGDNPGVTQIPRSLSVLKGVYVLKMDVDQFLPLERAVYKRSGGRGEEMLKYFKGLREGRLDLKGLDLEEWEIEESLVGLGFIQQKGDQQQDTSSDGVLTSLDLRKNPLINRIPLFLKDLPHLKSLSLDHTNPLGRFERTQYQTLSLAELRTYVTTLSSRPQKKLRQLKCMVIGRAASGKTTLVRRLRGENFDGKVEQTDGIDIGQLFLSPPQSSMWNFLGWGVSNGEGRDERTITLSTWDFGGQKMYRFS